MKLKSDPEVQEVFSTYPRQYRTKLKQLREIILESANELDEVTELEETLKWGEPSYLTKLGSTIRIAWKEKYPDKYSVFFKCTSKLVPTFRDIYADKFDILGDREFAFKLDSEIPKKELKNCIKAALMYHKVKELPNLGIKQ